MTHEVTVGELALELASGDPPLLLDVREVAERSISCLCGDRHVPLSELPGRVSELPLDRDIVVYCRSGMRSAHAVQFLRSMGFKEVRNLVGGINAWARELDPSMQTY